jgi:hypothetical protein
MVSASQIREEISQLLADKVDLDSFEDWIVRNTWNIHLSGSSAAENLAFAVEESLSEYSSGHITIEDLREELKTLVESENIILEIVDIKQPTWSPSLFWKGSIHSPTIWLAPARS